jgi:hypothetical protein
MTMKARTRRGMMHIAVVLILCMCGLEESASAQMNCRKVKGQATDVISGGILTHGGILNGTTQFVFTSGFQPTPLPTTVSFTADYTVTTRKGVLRIHSVYVYDFARLVAAAISHIDPLASTGVFAGATGMLYFNARSTDGGVTVESDISGEICLARAGDWKDEDH